MQLLTNVYVLSVHAGPIKLDWRTGVLSLLKITVLRDLGQRCLLPFGIHSLISSSVRVISATINHNLILFFCVFIVI